MSNYLRRLVTVLLLSGMTANVPASLITGNATANGSTSTIAGPVIPYYIPIASGSPQTYGVSGGGMSSDIVDLGSDGGDAINGAFLNMYLYFNIPDGEQGISLSLWFKDLDLEPSNDPDGFNESLTLYGQGGLPNSTFFDYAVIDALADASASGYGTNNDSVTIDFTNLDIGSGDFWLHLGFHATSDFTSGKWQNTVEKVSGTITTTEVPEPGSLVLMAIGLLSLFGIRRLRLQPVRIKKRQP